MGSCYLPNLPRTEQQTRCSQTELQMNANVAPKSAKKVPPPTKLKCVCVFVHNLFSAGDSSVNQFPEIANPPQQMDVASPERSKPQPGEELAVTSSETATICPMGKPLSTPQKKTRLAGCAMHPLPLSCLYQSSFTF